MNPQIPPDAIAEAARMWAHQPFRRCWVAVKEGETHRIILKSTAHVARRLAREGWTVAELKR